MLCFARSPSVLAGRPSTGCGLSDFWQCDAGGGFGARCHHTFSCHQVRAEAWHLRRLLDLLAEGLRSSVATLWVGIVS